MLHTSNAKMTKSLFTFNVLLPLAEGRVEGGGKRVARDAIAPMLLLLGRLQGAHSATAAAALLGRLDYSERFYAARNRRR